MQDAELWFGLAALVILALSVAVALLLRELHRRRRIDDAQRATEAQLRLLAEHSHDLVSLLDRRWRRTYASPASRTIMGLEPQALQHRHLLSSVCREDRRGVRKALARLRACKATEATITYRCPHASGRMVWIESTVRVIVDGASRRLGAVEVARDITQRKRQEHELRMLASIDALTNLPNRRAFDVAMEREWRRCAEEGRPLGLAMLDVDFFKQFNDRHGHPQGDRCLQTVARALAGMARTGSGDVVARYGGEEFAVILPDTGEEGAATAAERLRQAVLAERVKHAGRQDKLAVVSVSVGVACLWPTGGPEGAAALVAAADSALYQAKRNGRNRVMAASHAATMAGQTTAPAG